MDALLALAAACQDGASRLASGPFGVPLSLFLAGVAASLTHCLGMCGPFVLGLAAADAGPARAYGEWRRLQGAALAPYHLGRLTTYGALGALAAGSAGLVSSAALFSWFPSLLLVLSGLVMAGQALGVAFAGAPGFAAPLTRLAAGLSKARSPSSLYGMGVALGFLPCGLVYGALAAAAGTGSPLGGAGAMAAFGLGTTPALVAVGWGGLALRRRMGEQARWLATPLLLANAGLMVILAAARLPGD